MPLMVLDLLYPIPVRSRNEESGLATEVQHIMPAPRLSGNTARTPSLTRSCAPTTASVRQQPTETPSMSLKLGGCVRGEGGHREASFGCTPHAESASSWTGNVRPVCWRSQLAATARRDNGFPKNLDAAPTLSDQGVDKHLADARLGDGAQA